MEVPSSSTSHFFSPHGFGYIFYTFIEYYNYRPSAFGLVSVPSNYELKFNLTIETISSKIALTNSKNQTFVQIKFTRVAVRLSDQLLWSRFSNFSVTPLVFNSLKYSCEFKEFRMTPLFWPHSIELVYDAECGACTAAIIKLASFFFSEVCDCFEVKR